MNLSDVRILDLSRVLAGPYCTALLSDIGAEIIKVEVPEVGDDARHFGPFQNDESLYFAALNRNKRSIVLDLKNKAGRDTLLDLARCVDVLVENFRPGVTARLGIDYESLREINPRLIYASISGFGQDGPGANRPAYDLIVQAASGLMSMTGQPDGPPTRVGESVADVSAGLFAAWAISASLYTRERMGKGEHLDVSMLDAMMSMQVTALSVFGATGVAPGRIGNRHPVSTPFDSYRCKNGAVVVVAANNDMFRRLTEVIGRPELADDPRFSSDASRTQHEPELKVLIEDWTMQQLTTDVVDIATSAGVACGPILNLEEAIANPQVQYRKTVSSFVHDRAGVIPVATQPVRSTDAARRPIPHPDLGEHTIEILRDVLNLPDDELATRSDLGAFGPSGIALSKNS